jgi:hypothetical protein
MSFQLMPTTAAMLEQQRLPAAATSRCWHALQEQLESQALHLLKQSTHHNCHSPHHPFHVCPCKCVAERSAACKPCAAPSCVAFASCCLPMSFELTHMSTKQRALSSKGLLQLASPSVAMPCRNSLRQRRYISRSTFPNCCSLLFRVCHCRKRGPQAMRRTILRRLCKLLPPCEFAYAPSQQSSEA